MKSLGVILALGAAAVVGFVLWTKRGGAPSTFSPAAGPAPATVTTAPPPATGGTPNSAWGAAASIVSSLAPAITAYASKPAAGQTTTERAATSSKAA